MGNKNILAHFERVDIPDPLDMVIEQIHKLIVDGILKPGDKLPSEKRLEDKMGLPRGMISKAMRMMETYGIVKIVPQSGTYISDICVEALDGLLTNIISINMEDIHKLAAVRQLLETYAVELAIDNASDEDFKELEDFQNSLKEKVDSSEANFDNDLVFHLKIAAFSGNPVLKAVLTRLVVNMIELLNKYSKSIDEKTLNSRLNSAIEEHGEIIKYMKLRDKKNAIKALEQHFENAQNFRKLH